MTPKYPSSYGAGQIGFPQYVAEIMCERLAGKENKVLPCRFWNLVYWKKIFLQQVMAVNSLLKLYHSSAILAAVKANPTAYSLRAPWLDKVMQEEQAAYQRRQQALDKMPVIEELPEVAAVPEKPRQSFKSGQSTLDKLRSLDG
jgi:hypothetical protein